MLKFVFKTFVATIVATITVVGIIAGISTIAGTHTTSVDTHSTTINPKI